MGVRVKRGKGGRFAAWEDALAPWMPPLAARVLATLAVDGPATQVEIARRLGVWKGRVGDAVRHLRAIGALDEEPARRDGELGRPGIRLSVRAAGARELANGIEKRRDDALSVAEDLRRK